MPKLCHSQRHRLDIQAGRVPAALKELWRQDRQTSNDLEPDPGKLKYASPVSGGGQGSGEREGCAEAQLHTAGNHGEHPSSDLDLCGRKIVSIQNHSSIGK